MRVSVGTHDTEAGNQSWPKTIAYYLPQFHPIRENDEWWGNGFTEWRNVAGAKPLFRGHYQPQLPADLGFYDLRVPETREAQAELARSHGVYAFCYYYYWFAGKRILERPFDEVLESGKPEFPFCLCWANGSWTGIWKNAPDRVLIEQTYPGKEDYEKHFRMLQRAFEDERYVQVDGKPLILIDRVQEVPDLPQVTDYWRELAVKAGFKGIHVTGIRAFDWRPEQYGVDASVTHRLAKQTGHIPWRYPLRRLHKKLSREQYELTIYNYADIADGFIEATEPDFVDYPCIVPNWDNTPRCNVNGIVYHQSTPELFRKVVQKAFARVANASQEHRLVFLKSWNEWAEGNYIEPDLRWGTSYLEVLRQELARYGRATQDSSAWNTVRKRVSV